MTRTGTWSRRTPREGYFASYSEHIITPTEAPRSTGELLQQPRDPRHREDGSDCEHGGKSLRLYSPQAVAGYLWAKREEQPRTSTRRSAESASEGQQEEAPTNKCSGRFAPDAACRACAGRVLCSAWTKAGRKMPHWGSNFNPHGSPEVRPLGARTSLPRAGGGRPFAAGRRAVAAHRGSLPLLRAAQAPEADRLRHRRGDLQAHEEVSVGLGSLATDRDRLAVERRARRARALAAPISRKRRFNDAVFQQRRRRLRGCSAGLVLCSVETDTIDELERVALPRYAGPEVTHDPFFSGGRLCLATAGRA